MKLKAPLALTAVLFAFACATLAAQMEDSPRQLARDIFRQLIEINTTDSVGSTAPACEAMAQRLRDAGIPASDIQILGPSEKRENLVARYRGTGARRPILMIGHLDVVEAPRLDWSSDPFQFVVKDGYAYGRGTQDMKDGDAIYVATLIGFAREHYRPDRDIILALTADEESGDSDGVDWLLRNHRDLIDAEYALNADAGGVYTRNGRPVMMSVDGSEKIYADYQMEAKNAGGHSSLPVPDNAIYHLTDGLGRLERYRFPFELNAVTRAYFLRMAGIESGQTADDMRAITRKKPDPRAIERLSADPLSNATMRTTCVATRFDAGIANNALPQLATAIVNCRILPGHTQEEIRRKLIEIVADPAVTIRYVSDAGEVMDTAPTDPPAPPVALRPEIMEPLERIAQEMWPGIVVMPTMATGASDGVFTNAAGMPTYGISGVALDFNDVRAHARDERLRLSAFDDGAVFYERFLRALTSTTGASRADRGK